MVWVVVEFLLPFIFPWYMANGQYLFYPAIQIVELTGVMGLSFLIVLVNCGLYLGAVRAAKRHWGRAARPVGIAAALFAVNLLYGVVRMYQVDADMAEAQTLRIGLGEADVGIFEKEARGLTDRRQKLDLLRGNILKHHLLAAELEAQGADLIVEPESSFIPSPEHMVRFKRTEVFAIAAGRGRDAWELRDDAWSGPQRVEREAGAIYDVAAAREDQIFAVGPGGLVLRQVGEDWVREKSGVSDVDLHGVWVGEIAPTVERIDGIAVIAAAVGDSGTVVLRHAPEEWQPWDTGLSVTLRGVSGSGALRIVAVGDQGSALVWGGKSWRAEKTKTTVDLHDVWMGKDGTATAVGDDGVVARRSGAGWSVTKIQGARGLRGISGSSSGLWAVGEAGRVYHRPSTKWVRVEAPTNKTLHGVSQTGRGDILAVGEGGIVLRRRPTDATFSATTPLRGAGDLYAVAGVPFTEAHAFGRDARFLYKGQTALPDTNMSTLDAVSNISKVLPLDTRPRPEDWNTPLRGFDKPILMGVLTYEPKDPNESALRGRDFRRTYNSAMLLGGDGRVLGRYDKNYLLVFGEYIPFGEWFPQLYDMLPEASHFYAGETVETFAFQGHQLGVIICYEDILPGFTRNLAGKDPNVLINVTNDAWFGKTSEPYLHLALSIFRSVENRLWLIRSTNTGVTAFVDAVGRIVAETGLEEPEILVQDVPMMRSSTLYRSYGELFTWLCLLAFAVIAIGGLRRRPKRRAEA